MSHSRHATSLTTFIFDALNSSGAFFCTFVLLLMPCSHECHAGMSLAINAASLIKRIVREWVSPLVRMKGT